MATRGDLDSCLRLLDQLWQSPEQLGVTDDGPSRTSAKEVLTRLLESSDAMILVAEEGETIVGLADITLRDTIFHGGRTLIIEDIVVDEVHRGKGDGAKMVRFIEDMARRKGCRGIELSSDLHRHDTHRFWEAMGYECLAYQFRKVLVSADAETNHG